MILHRLFIKDFLIFDQVDLDLRDIKLVSVIGQHISDRRRSNGSGKSALIESIFYALFDKTRSKSKSSIIRNGQDKCIVEIEFEVGGHRVKVRRERCRDGSASSSVWIDGRLSGDKIKVVNEVVEKCVGVDSEIFQLIYFFKQNDQFGFAEADPGERKSLLAKVFRMNSLVKCLEIAKSKYDAARDAVLHANGVCEALRSRANSLRPYQELQEQELAISGNLASALQICHDSVELNQLTIESVDEFESRYIEFKVESENDRRRSKELSSLIEKTITTIQNLNASIQESEGGSAALNAQIERLQDSIFAGESSSEIQAKIRLIDKEIQDLSNQVAVKLSKVREFSQSNINQIVGKDCPTCGQFVKVDYASSFLEKTKESKLKLQAEVVELNQSIAWRKKERDRINSDLQKSIASQGIRDQISAYEKSLKVYRNDINSKKDQVNSLQADLHAYNSEYSQVTSGGDEDEMVSLIRCVEWYRSRVLELKKACSARNDDLNYGEISDIQRKYDHITRSINERRKIDSEVKEAELKLKSLQDDSAIWLKLVEIFGKNGLQAIIIENAIGVIESFANEILKDMQTKFVLELRTQKETKAGDLRESLDIIAYDNGNERPFENYSGGERTLINIALRLALSRVISSLHGVRMQSLFLDEVLAPLDEVNRQQAVRVVAFLSRSFEQIFVISHTDEIKDVIDNVIIVERHEDHSVVKVSNDRI